MTMGFWQAFAGLGLPWLGEWGGVGWFLRWGNDRRPFAIIIIIIIIIVHRHTKPWSEQYFHIIIIIIIIIITTIIIITIIKIRTVIIIAFFCVPFQNSKLAVVGP